MTNPKKKNFFSRLVDYCDDCYKELKYKVSWPTSKELTNSSVIVLTASLILSLFIFLVDQGFEFIVGGIYKVIG